MRDVRLESDAAREDELVPFREWLRVECRADEYLEARAQKGSAMGQRGS